MGSRTLSESCVLANASPTVRPRPISSPVLFISGPSTGSAFSRSNGKAGAFTATPPYSTGGSSGTLSSSSESPAIAQAPTLAQGTPVALLTNGTVRDALGFTSSTYTSSPRTAYCTFMSPTTPKRWASFRV